MTINKTQLIQVLNRMAKYYHEAAILPNEISHRLIDHLNFFNPHPKLILDLGCKTGFTSALLKEKYPQATIVSMDIAEQMIKHSTHPASSHLYQLCADPESLPFSADEFDLVFSNLTIHWFDFNKIFKEIFRILARDGIFLFSTFGVDTLHELRHSWESIDAYCHTHPFIDMHHLGDSLLQTQFADPVMETEHLTLTYKSVLAFLRNLKQMGYQNLFPERSFCLTGKKHFKLFATRYEKLFGESSIIPATFEIIYGYAKKSKNSYLNERGEVNIPVSAIRRLS